MTFDRELTMSITSSANCLMVNSLGFPALIGPVTDSAVPIIRTMASTRSST